MHRSSDHPLFQLSTRFYDLVIPELRVLYINITKNFFQRGIPSRENLEKRERERERKRKGSFILRNFLFVETSRSWIKREGGKKRIEKNSFGHGDTEWKSGWNGSGTRSFSRRSSNPSVTPNLSSMEETCTRSYRYPINRSVEQILPRVLFRTPSSSVPCRDSSIKCRVSRASPRASFHFSRKSYEDLVRKHSCKFRIFRDQIKGERKNFELVARGRNSKGMENGDFATPSLHEWRSFGRRGEEFVIKFRKSRLDFKFQDRFPPDLFSFLPFCPLACG